ncbi:Wadjet anti-phage system protein JetD domain-containing protein [Chromohalobacter beijerinckii]|uniref:Wadjet anti-phage system protein JetD domain-containing protein n=1 Tax=Chromohalobacter beijerinckii TaxID=86179 RepID=A0ABV8X8X4_9GAMM|nr:Wadjet anti-phage system protein JetD domain-containing protein [Chromohalobacter beijerinckii]MCK0767045.1 DUF2220 domain-containing protein [Chromohalobacter beijerinckii]
MLRACPEGALSGNEEEQYNKRKFLQVKHIIEPHCGLLSELFEAHRPVWGREDDAKRFTGVLDNLTEAERDVFETLSENRLAPALRLEQEHIAQRWLLEALSRFKACPAS